MSHLLLLLNFKTKEINPIQTCPLPNFTVVFPTTKKQEESGVFSEVRQGFTEVKLQLKTAV